MAKDKQMRHRGRAILALLISIPVVGVAYPLKEIDGFTYTALLIVGWGLGFYGCVETYLAERNGEKFPGQKVNKSELSSAQQRKRETRCKQAAKNGSLRDGADLARK